MLDMNEVNREIQILENCNITNYTICKKLAILYIIKDHYGKNKNNNSNIIDNDKEPLSKMMSIS